ncbi:uncharacterized protein B0H18DRAFT_222344 [Fomitopsis serialis]|uniref:uncharacterized protein n=1 Tax=Fomitopsis serialis TaxID=139415 RepID=UPI0020083102|nr:uncharacterized protein B0H18DRAFT_222344 [Neoantrodia serialis]KAH9929224.1 hypothetical protein B0H18DRAFT_222344 [Neoantrodia serialis]
MSSANVAANASYDMLVNYVFYATAALYLYDRIISIGQEVDCIWRRRNTRIIVPALYVMMHSCAMLYLLLNPLQDIPNCQLLGFFNTTDGHHLSHVCSIRSDCKSPCIYNQREKLEIANRSDVTWTYARGYQHILRCSLENDRFPAFQRLYPRGRLVCRYRTLRKSLRDRASL